MAGTGIACTFLPSGFGVPLGLVLLAAARAAEGRLRLRREWLWVWGVLGLSLLPVRVATEGVRGGLDVAASVAFGVAAGSLLAWRRTVVVRALLVVLIVLPFAAGIGWWRSGHAWRHDYNLFASWRSLTAPATERVSGHGSRSWRAPEGARDPTFRIEVRLVGGELGWDWRRTDPGFELAPARDATGAFTRVVAPVGRDPYLERSVDLDRPAAGRTFRLQIELRSGAPPEAAPGARIELLDVAGAGRGAELPVVPMSEWRRYTLDWTAPEAATGTTLRLLLNDFDGTAFDVRDARVFERDAAGERWLELGPVVDTGLFLRLDDDGGLLAGARVTPQREWTSYAVAVEGRPLAAGREVRAGIVLGEGLTVEVRDARLSAAEGEPFVPVLRDRRQELWFTHPNLLGHSAVAAGLVASLASSSLAVTLLSAPAVLVTAVLAGSRTALLVALLAYPALLVALDRRRSRRRVALLAAALALAAAAVAWIAPLDGLRFRADPNSVSRPEIWRVAGRALLEHPLTGVPEGDFASFFRELRGGVAEAPVTHAHDLWLDFGARYGVPGLAGILVFTGGLALLWIRRGGAAGAIVLGGIYLLNVPDVSLPFTPVLFAAILGTNTLPASRAPATSGEGGADVCKSSSVSRGR